MTTCALCGPLGDRLLVDFLEGEGMPAAARALVRVGVEANPQGIPDTLEQCPKCGAHFLFESLIDNDVFQPRDDGRWTRLTPEQVARWRAAQQPGR